MGHKAVRFDPRTKLIALLVVNLLLLASHSFVLELMLFLYSEAIIIASRRIASAAKYLAVFVVMLLVDKMLTPRLSDMAFALVSFVALTLRKFMPCWILGRWILTTTQVSAFVAVMRKMHVSQSVIIPLSVMFRYFPTIREEWESIRAAMRMRGICFSVEHIMVPLIFSAVNVGEELSAAALCRGLDAPGEHTSYVEVGFGLADYLAMVVLVVYGALLIVLNACCAI